MRVWSLLVVVFVVASAVPVEAAQRVRSYTTKRGTYVAPSYRTKSDATKLNNWSTKGNTNPYTLKKGTKR